MRHAPTPTIAVHGGAGRPSGPADPTADAGLRAALAVGGERLAAADGALGAVEAAVRVLEEHPAFNAGRGAVLNERGEVELDASIACGATGAAGAVAAVTGVRHPISLARALLEEGRHVLLAGPAARALAAERRLELADGDQLVTPGQRERWREWRAGRAPGPALGTVGAVALDADGHLAAATSTGGTRGKRSGRVGDSAIPGAGTWAADETVAVSLTGDGEGIMRAVAAHELAALIALGGLELAAAARIVIDERLGASGVDAGLIALDRAGRFVDRANCELLYRGLWRSGAAIWTASAANAPGPDAHAGRRS